MDNTVQEVVDLRRKVLAGEPVTQEEYAKVIEAIRAGRKKAGEVKEKKKAAKKEGTRKVSLESLFGPRPVAEPQQEDDAA